MAQVQAKIRAPRRLLACRWLAVCEELTQNDPLLSGESDEIPRGSITQASHEALSDED